MRKDISYFIPADVPSVYNAYLAAASNDKFRCECNQEPYHTLTFGLNFSAKFNFNGGACTLHFIPWQNGTAVDYRFSLAQLGGGRCEKYADELNADAMAILGTYAQKTNIPVETFLNADNKVFAAGAAKPAAPPPPPAQNIPVNEPPVQEAYATASATRVYPDMDDPVPPRLCSACGAQMQPGAMFCIMCGTKNEPVKPAVAAFCSACGTKFPDDVAKFCMACGTKR